MIATSSARRPAPLVEVGRLDDLLGQPLLIVAVEDGEARLAGRPARRARAASARPWRGRCRATCPATLRPISRSTRSTISRAARLVKVTASTSCGRARPVSRMCASRVVSTRVLPVPAPASTSSGPSAAVDRRPLLRVQPAQIGRVALQGWPRHAVPDSDLTAHDSTLSPSRRLATSGHPASPRQGGADPRLRCSVARAHLSVE